MTRNVLLGAASAAALSASVLGGLSLMYPVGGGALRPALAGAERSVPIADLTTTPRVAAPAVHRLPPSQATPRAPAPTAAERTSGPLAAAIEPPEPSAPLAAAAQVATGVDLPVRSAFGRLPEDTSAQVAAPQAEVDRPSMASHLAGGPIPDARNSVPRGLAPPAISTAGVPTLRPAAPTDAAPRMIPSGMRTAPRAVASAQTALDPIAEIDPMPDAGTARRAAPAVPILVRAGAVGSDAVERVRRDVVVPPPAGRVGTYGRPAKVRSVQGSEAARPLAALDTTPPEDVDAWGLRDAEDRSGLGPTGHEASRLTARPVAYRAPAKVPVPRPWSSLGTASEIEWMPSDRRDAAGTQHGAVHRFVPAALPVPETPARARGARAPYADAVVVLTGPDRRGAPEDDAPMADAAAGAGRIALVAPEDVVVAPPRAVEPASGAGDAEPTSPMPRRIVMDRDARRGIAPTTPALVRDALPFHADGRAVVTVVLVDDGAPLALFGEAGLPRDLAVTVAVDPTLPDAAERAQAHRAAGREVMLAGTALPEGAAAQDVEVSLAAAIGAVESSVALLDLSDRRAMDAGAILPVLAEGGRGLVTLSDRLGALDAARRAGVPAVKAFRLLDDEGRWVDGLARDLDRATFEALRDGAAVVAGRWRRETLEAIALWLARGRGDEVQLAPISAVLTGAG